MPWPIEAKLTIGFWLEERNRIWADGIVISHHQGLGMGIKFRNLSRKNLNELKLFIELLPNIQALSRVQRIRNDWTVIIAAPVSVAMPLTSVLAARRLCKVAAAYFWNVA